MDPLSFFQVGTLHIFLYLLKVFGVKPFFQKGLVGAGQRPAVLSPRKKGFTMNIATIKSSDIANGSGVRVSVFVSGCRHACPGCFNREAWDFDYGVPYTPAIKAEILDALAPDHIAGLTLLGGEPFEPENRAELTALCRNVRTLYPTKTVWCFSGFTLEELTDPSLPAPDTARALLAELDVLVDGRFELDKKNLSLRFRGSSNQRILDVPASLAAGEPVWMPGEWERKPGRGIPDRV